MTPRRKRFILLLGAIVLLLIATGLIVSALRQNLIFFYTPTEVFQQKAPKDRSFRLGGMVVTGSLHRSPKDHLDVEFAITDMQNQVAVRYHGSLPNLFVESKGAVVQGQLNAEGVFIATQVLAKHDENYMPPEAQYAVDKAHDTARTLQP